MQGQQGSDFGLTGAIPAAIADLVHLTTLDFSYNQLSVLPNEIDRLTRLEALDLHNNQLEHSSDEEAKLTPVPDGTTTPGPEADVIINTTEHRLYLPTVRR